MKSRIEQLQEFLEEDSNDSFLKYALALEYIRIEKKDAAKNCFLKLVEEDENYLASYYQLGKLYESVNELEHAIEIYKKGIKIAKKNEDKKTLLELQESYNMLMDIDEDEVPLFL
jgi:tetratricopeptide (TPR) repeat protein